MELAARLVEPGGSLALVWTEVISSGQEPIESLPYPLYQLASDLQAWPGRSEPIGSGVEPCRSSRMLSERSWGRPRSAAHEISSHKLRCYGAVWSGRRPDWLRR